MQYLKLFWFVQKFTILWNQCERWICIKHQFTYKNIIVEKNVNVNLYHNEYRALKDSEAIAAIIKNTKIQLITTFHTIFTAHALGSIGMILSLKK